MIRTIFAFSLGAVLWAASDPGLDPLPPLPPRPVPLQVDISPTHNRNEDPRHIGDDLLQLRESVERVTKALTPNTPPATTGTGVGDTTSTSIATMGDVTVRHSQRFENKLSVTRSPAGELTVTAAIRRERLEGVYRELGQLLDRPVDDSQITITQRLVSLEVTDLPWDECLDRLFGQAGIGWSESGSASSAKLILFEHPDPKDQVRLTAIRNDRSRRALLRAATGDSQAYAAEALFRIAALEAQEGQHLDAIRGYSRLITDFDSSADPGVAIWVMRAIRGIADAMVEAGQPAEALSVYRSYITRAQPDENELPIVYLSAARAALAQAKRGKDASARDEAALLLGGLIERFTKRPDAAGAVAEARLSLGELMVDAKRWQEAEQHFADHVRATRKEDTRIAYWRAECQFHLGLFEDARKRYERTTADASGALTDEERAHAALRIGECLLHQRPPQYARALFAFLRARQEWPRLRMEGEVMVAVARCYAELENEEGAITEFWTLLRGDAIDDQGARDQLGQFLGGLQGNLANYDTTIRARVLFYIAEADHRHAWRDHGQRSQLVADAIQRYDRVLKENPTADLRNAARLGMARVAFLGKEDALGTQVLTELLQDPESTLRDRQLASQTLGDYLRDQGRLREAITAYEGAQP
jgi:tetratricopeptide (TPR) repeat protein